MVTKAPADEGPKMRPHYLQSTYDVPQSNACYA